MLSTSKILIKNRKKNQHCDSKHIYKKYQTSVICNVQISHLLEIEP